MKKSIGASYSLNQTPGAERMGGLQVVIRPKQGDEGTITIRPTERTTGDTLDGLGSYADAALRGIREVAREHDVDLSRFDVILSDWLVHPVDSRASCYYHTGKSAFRSALEAWTGGDLF